MTEKDMKKMILEAKKFLKLVESLLWASTKIGGTPKKK